jgi:hypothetical protein
MLVESKNYRPGVFGKNEMKRSGMNEWRNTGDGGDKAVNKKY